MPLRVQLHFMLSVALALTLSSCATTPSPQASRVLDADEKMVGSCTFLAQVQGSSGWGNAAASVGMENARTEAREKAAKLGASHIVWAAISGGYAPYVSGRAYKCS